MGAYLGVQSEKFTSQSSQYEFYNISCITPVLSILLLHHLHSFPDNYDN